MKATDPLIDRALWHLEIGYPEAVPVGSADHCEGEDHEDEADGVCLDCGQIHDLCECHVGEECGRWNNGHLSSLCRKAGSEECDFECPHRNSLRF